MSPKMENSAKTRLRDRVSLGKRDKKIKSERMKREAENINWLSNKNRSNFSN